MVVRTYYICEPHDTETVVAYVAFSVQEALEAAPPDLDVESGSLFVWRQGETLGMEYAVVDGNVAASPSRCVSGLDPKPVVVGVGAGRVAASPGGRRLMALARALSPAM